jgi:hypothetical protein
MEASLEYRHLARMQKRLDKAFHMMNQARLEHRRLSDDRDRLAYHRSKRDNSYRSTDARRAQAADRRRNQASETYRKHRSRYEKCKASYHDMTHELRQQMRPIAQDNGIPARYLDDYRVVLKKDGEVHFYFGGDGHPLGDGHAHVVLNPDGSLKYLRNPRSLIRSDEVFPITA